MAQTVTFSGGGFNIQDTLAPGTQSLAYSSSNQSPAPSYLLKNTNNSEIKGLGFQDNTNTGVTLSITSQTRTTASNSTFTLGSGNDTLVIGSSKDNNFFMGNGNNNVTIQYGTNNDTINFGTGADTLVFGGKIQNTLVQLTTDTSVDTIKIGQANNTPSTGALKITGATDIDVLFIGSTEYSYDSNQGLWVNDSNPGDTKNFS
jgi:Ca2+-binding RTX toxin-like protein